jgi:TnpA family transposase
MTEKKAQLDKKPSTRGLLKIEQLHALARDIFYGKRGRIQRP